MAIKKRIKILVDTRINCRFRHSQYLIQEQRLYFAVNKVETQTEISKDRCKFIRINFGGSLHAMPEKGCRVLPQ